MTERERPQAQVDAQASEWLARHRLEALSAQDERAFQAWMAADPRHARAFDSMNRTLGDIAALKTLAELEPLEPAARRALPLRASHRGRRMAAAIAGLGAATAVALAVVVAPGLISTPDLEQSTAVAEIRPLTLADGSTVTLGARSRIEVDFEGDARRVKLLAGEAFFEVAHDPARPFFVETGGAMVRVVGTKFDVKRIEGRVEVAVLEGVVQVSERRLLPGAPQTRTLTAGQQVAAIRGGIPILPAPAASIGKVEAATTAPGAWRGGQLTYDDTRLSELVADLNRYYAPGVRLQSRAVGDVRLAASFKVHEIDDFLRDLPAVAGVAVSRDAAGAVTITDGPAA